MPKRLKTTFNSRLHISYFYNAHARASKNKHYRRQVLEMEMNLEQNLVNLIGRIKNNDYHLGQYREFIVYEPKKRVIRTLPYIDRIVHQWYIEEFIKNYFTKMFIYDSYACLANKGSHKAVKRLQYFMRLMRNKEKSYYILKCDVKKYFNSIDKEILLNILKRKIKDKKIIEFSKILIFENNDDNGLPIGNYTSQYFANIYLNELDYYVKHTLKIEYYLRYMDDFVILIENKISAKKIFEKIERFLNTNLNLELNKKSKYYPSKLGCDFCGYVVYEDYIKLRKRAKKKIYKNVKIWNELYLTNQLNYNKFLLSYNSFLGHISHSNSYNFLLKVNSKIIFSLEKR